MNHRTSCSGPSPFAATAPTRRDFLWRFGGGLGGVAAACLLGADGLLASDSGGIATPQSGGLLYQTGGLHHPARAKRVIQIFLNGGMSQMDTFDRKPRLDELHGKPFDPGNGQKVESV